MKTQRMTKASFTAIGKGGQGALKDLQIEKHLPKPSVNEVEKYLKKWDSQKYYSTQESALDKLFLKIYPHNTDIDEILIKVSCLNDFYSTNIYDTFSVAENIKSITDLDKRLEDVDYSLVHEIAKVKIKETDKNFYSFATKYCSHHNEKFPIYDSYVDKCLWYFRQQDNFSGFKHEDLKNYEKFTKILNEFSEYYKLQKPSAKELDKYLWQLGKEYFPKNYKN